MTSVAIITSVSQKSSRQLAEALINNGIKAKVFSPFKDGEMDMRGFTHTFGYGCSARTSDNIRLNKGKAVETCVNKVATFEALKKAGCNTVPYTTNIREVPKTWEQIVCRTKVNGRKAEGYDVLPQGSVLPAGELYTEYFYHKYEYRIMVFRGEVVARYFKNEVKGDHIFNLQPKRGFEVMDDHCIRAAAALGIDYVGFDVVANNKRDFRILEGNSGALLTDECEDAIVSYFINL